MKTGAGSVPVFAPGVGTVERNLFIHRDVSHADFSTHPWMHYALMGLNPIYAHLFHGGGALGMRMWRFESKNICTTAARERQ
jgi:hypothetical protein